MTPAAMTPSLPADVSTPGLAAHYATFLAYAAGALALACAIGLVPTQRLAGSDGVQAMFAACAVAFVAALVGTVPVVLAQHKPAHETVPAVMGSIAARSGAIILLGVAVALTGLVAIKPFAVWLVIGHAALLVADIRFTKRVLYSN